MNTSHTVIVDELRTASERWSHIPVIATINLLAIMMFGCHTSTPNNKFGYETIGKDPKRDTELAKRDNLQAIELIKKEHFAEAETLLKEALEADVTYGPAHNNLGKAYFHDSELYLAAWEFQYAAKLMPDVPEPKNNLGLVLESVGKLDEAVTAYDEALKMGADNVQFLGNDARARYRRGDRDDRLRQLLQDLVIRDNRSDWSQWARERLILLGSESATRPS